MIIQMVLGGALSNPVYGDPVAEKKGLDKLINKTKNQIIKERRKERSVLGNLLGQQKELNKLEQHHNQVKQQLGKAKNELLITKLELNGLKKNMRTLNSNLESQRDRLGNRLASLYKYGPQTFLETLFSAEDFVDFISRYDTMAYLVRNDLRVIGEFKSTLQEIGKQKKAVEAKEVQVEREYRQIAALKEKVYAQQQKVISKVKDTQLELAKIQNNRAALEKALNEYEQTSKEIEAQIRRQQSGSTKFLGTGRLIWPLHGRVISSSYGWRVHPILKTKKFHSGLDIAVASGTPVAAADDGVVLVSGWKGGYGNFVAIDHGGGISTCYGHNSKLLVKVGDKVSKGQRIALSGNTGLSTGPHLHFEVRIKGSPRNPLDYLR